jgi:hypothetical protein
MKLEFSLQIFEKYSNVIHENQSNGSRVGLYRQTDMAQLIVAFRSFANASKMAISLMSTIVSYERSKAQITDATYSKGSCDRYFKSCHMVLLLSFSPFSSC